MSLEKFDTRDVNGVRQNKGLRLRGFATLCGAPFYYPIRKDYNLWTGEPLHKDYNLWTGEPLHTKREVTRPTQEMRTRSRILETQEEHSIDHSNLIYIEISEVGLRLIEGCWSFKLSQQWSDGSSQKITFWIIRVG